MSWSDADRSPSADPNALDWASFYVEELKYGSGPGTLERAMPGEIAEQLDRLLRDAHVPDAMPGAELERAMLYYGASLANTFRMPRVLALSIFCDGLMHGIALAGGLKGKPRNPT